MTAVGRLVISRLLNFAAGLERVYDPFLFPVLGTKESIKKGKTIFAIQLAVYIYQKYIQCIFIYLFILYSEISDRFPENGGNWCGSAPGKECFSLKKTYICTTGFTLVVMGFALHENGKEKQKYSQLSLLLRNNSQQSIFQFFDALSEQFSDGIEKVYQRAFLDVQLLSLLWLITSHLHIPSFFGVMVLISAFESSGVLIEGAMSSSHSVTTLR